jgi:hypothetical protein
LVQALDTLTLYDEGKLPRLPGKYISDETILRNYADHNAQENCPFPMDPFASEAPLLHFSRSSLKGTYEQIPLV